MKPYLEFIEECRVAGVEPPTCGKTCLELRWARERYERTGKPQRVTWEAPGIPWFVWPSDITRASPQAVAIQGPDEC